MSAPCASDDFEFLRLLGQGTFGAAYLARDRSSGQLLAVKLVQQPTQVYNLKKEVLNLYTLRHPLTTGLHSVSILPGGALGIAMEYVNGGNLYQKICRSPAARFTEAQARYFFQQIVVGLEYMHEQGVSHRDLKLENLLVDASPTQILKICDFGFSKSTVWDSMAKSTVGTQAYMAPEVWTAQQGSVRQYDARQSDVWACGVILFTMLLGQYPFEVATVHASQALAQSSIPQLMARLTSPSTGVALSPACCDLIGSLFIADPAQRIKITEIKQHPWYRQDLPPSLASPEACRAALPTFPPCRQSMGDILALLDSLVAYSDPPQQQLTPSPPAHSPMLNPAVSPGGDQQDDPMEGGGVVQRRFLSLAARSPIKPALSDEPFQQVGTNPAVLDPPPRPAAASPLTPAVSNGLQLDFSHSNLTAIPLHLMLLPMLDRLNLSHNSFTELEPAALQLSSLTCLKLASNQLAAFPPVLCGMSWLLELDLSGNALVRLPQEVLGLSSLRLLELGGNPLVGLTPGSQLASLRHLKHLGLARDVEAAAATEAQAQADPHAGPESAKWRGMPPGSEWRSALSQLRPAPSLEQIIVSANDRATQTALANLVPLASRMCIT